MLFAIIIASSLALASVHASHIPSRPHDRSLGLRDTQRKIRKRGCKVDSSGQYGNSNNNEPILWSSAPSPPSSSAPAALASSSSVPVPSNTTAVGVQRPSEANTLNQTPTIDAVVAVSTGKRFNYGTDKIRGVNLGGWLVIESFLTPSLFSNTGNGGIVDEWTFAQYQDRSAAAAALRNHWNTFITEDDFAQIAAAGINHVRIPVGFWSWDVQGDEPYIQGAEEYLDKAIDWARKHDLKVLIDLHGVPGSQNGYDHSGRKGNAQWHTNPDNVKRSIEVIRRLAAKYGSSPYSDTVRMLQLLNEPTLFSSDDLKGVTKQYYITAYEAARRPWGLDGGETDLIIVFHDGFQPMSWWTGFMPEGTENLWIDTHYYQAFDRKYFDISAEQHLRYVCEGRQNYQTSPFPTISGEWSIAVWSCTPAERNTAMGNIGTCNLNENNAMADYAIYLRAFFDIQVEMFETVGKGQGWFYFNWKTENLAEWSYQKSLENGWIPRSPSEHQFNLGTICQ